MKEAVVVPRAVAPDVYWWSRWRVRRIAESSALLLVSLTVSIWWIFNTDWRHPVSVQKQLLTRVVHFVNYEILPHISTLVDWFFTVTYVVIPVVALFGVLIGAGGLYYSLHNPKASLRYRKLS